MELDGRPHDPAPIASAQVSDQEHFVGHLAAVLWLAAAGLYLSTERMAASAFSPPYSYAHYFISDLGVPVCGSIFEGRAICSPLHKIVNSAFALHGLLFLGAALTVTWLISNPAKFAFIAFATLHCVGMVLIGAFPAGGPHLRIHVAGAFISIAAGNGTALISVAIFRKSQPRKIHQAASIGLPALAAMALALLMTKRTLGATYGPPAAALERISVYTITIWEVISAVCIWLWTRDSKSR